jgi:hypothetical protein
MNPSKKIVGKRTTRSPAPPMIRLHLTFRSCWCVSEGTWYGFGVIESILGAFVVEVDRKLSERAALEFVL